MRESIEPNVDTVDVATTESPSAASYQFEKPSLTFGDLRTQYDAPQSSPSSQGHNSIEKHLS